jgi:hypothetical protein
MSDDGNAHAELTAIIDNGANYERDPDTSGWNIVPEWAATAIITAGYVKVPSREALGSVIWHASRADEGTISVTGANIIADAILALLAGQAPHE